MHSARNRQPRQADPKLKAALANDDATARSFIRLPRFRSVIWLMPAAYVLHILEEYIGGFSSWVNNDVRGTFDNLAFALNNIAFMAILITLVTLNFRISARLPRIALVVFASANLFWDGLFHLLSTPVLNAYSPGTVTAMLLYYPLSILIGIVIIREGVLTRLAFFSATAGGLALFAFVVWYGLFHFAV